MQLYDDVNNCWVNHRDLPEYQMRKRKVRDAWIGLGLVMLLMPTGILFVTALLGCFLSFMFLDEKPYELSKVEISSK